MEGLAKEKAEAEVAAAHLAKNQAVAEAEKTPPGWERERAMNRVSIKQKNFEAAMANAEKHAASMEHAELAAFSSGKASLESSGASSGMASESSSGASSGIASSDSSGA